MQINRPATAERISLACPRCGWKTEPMTASRVRYAMTRHVGARHPDVAEGRRAEREREREVFRREHTDRDGVTRRGGARITDGREHPVTIRRLE